MLDSVFRAYGKWIGAYFSGDKNASSYYKEYQELVAKLPVEERKVWPN
jgi:hypothetical protein